ncbi:MAG: hypothetical protein KGO53_09255 [Alphaproteobacteria bacterium]|nr:hypothetical protein [Alphaproteobacteria bacterium]
MAVQPALAETASLQGLSGKVLISHGQGFAAAEAGAILAGEQILTGPDGHALVRFPACTVTLKGAALYTVPAKTPCTPGQDIAMAGVFAVTPASVGATQFAQLDQLTYRARDLENEARLANDQPRLDCLAGKEAEIKALRHYLLRNPGVEENERIAFMTQDLETCQASLPAAPVPAPAPVATPPVVAAAPAVDGTGLLIGGGLAVAGLAAGAYALLGNKGGISKN